MMIHAYQEIYLSKAQAILADTFDYAINTCDINGNEFVKLFITSSVSKRMENGEPTYLVGKSGIEVVKEILMETKGQSIQAEPKENFNRSKEYWIGWAIAYYQWYSNRHYKEIFKALTFEDLEKMYYTLHEADISKFVDIVDARIKEYFPETNLKRLRISYGCTQAELSRRSGVCLRSIQMYEQRNKDINKAGADTIYRLAKILGCTMEDLIEKG